MPDPCFAIEAVVSQRINATIGPFHRDPLHVTPVQTVIASKNYSTLQEEAAIGHVAPHVEADFFPSVNGQPDPLQLHVQDPPLRHQSVQHPMPY